MMMLEKRSKEFFNIALKNTQEADNVGLLVGHLCWNNYEVSRRFAKFLLRGLNSTSENEVKPFVQVMKVFLGLNDIY